MAKLDNVKVVNENTVEYNGFVYELVTDEAKVCNLIQCFEDDEWLVRGGFYYVYDIDSDGDMVFNDEEEDSRYRNPNSNNWKVFRKSHAITNDSLTDAEGVVKIELPDGTKLEGTPSDLEKITRKLQEMQAEQVATVEMPEEAVEVEDESEPVQSCLQVDDYAKVIVDTCDVFEEGEIVKIIHTDSSILPYKGEQLSSDRYEWLYESDVVRATEAEVKAATQPKEVEEAPLKVGDYAKVVEEGSHGFTKNDVVRIYDIVDYGRNRIRGEYLSGKRIVCDYFFKHELVKATDAEVLAVKQELLKEGDFARVISNASTTEKAGAHKFEIGTVVKLKNGAWDDVVFKAYYLDESDWWNVHRKDLEPLTAEEAEHIAREAEEEKKAKAERAKWAAIGREVGEIKKGDIVRVVKEGKPDHVSDHEEGDIGVVTSADGTDRPWVSVNGNGQFSYVELITPVEQRFDKAE